MVRGAEARSLGDRDPNSVALVPDEIVDAVTVDIGDEPRIRREPTVRRAKDRVAELHRRALQFGVRARVERPRDTDDGQDDGDARASAVGAEQ